VDQLLLSLFDRAFLMADIGHRADLLLRDEGPLFQSPAGEQHVREADQQPRRSRKDARQEHHERSEGERDAIAVQDGVRLRHRFHDDEVDQRESHGDQRHPEIVRVPLGDDRDHDGRAVLAEHHRQVDRVQVPRRLLLDALEQRGVAPSVLAERHRAHPAHTADRRLGHGEHRAEEHEQDDDRYEPAHEATARAADRTRRSSRAIASSLAGSA
jgi:hypothetical protein